MICLEECGAKHIRNLLSRSFVQSGFATLADGGQFFEATLTIEGMFFSCTSPFGLTLLGPAQAEITSTGTGAMRFTFSRVGSPMSAMWVG